MRNLFFPLIIIAITLFLCQQKGFTEDFRHMDFGMSLEEVMSVETQDLIIQESNQLVYHANVLEKDSLLIYYFIDGVCYGAGYLFLRKYEDPQHYIDDYDEAKEYLIILYNEPEEDNMIWYTDLFQENPEFYGLAVKSDWLAYQTKWNHEDISILMTLKGDGDRVFHSIYYEDDTLSGQVDESYKRTLLEDL